jgi:hypothetical protein
MHVRAGTLRHLSHLDLSFNQLRLLPPDINQLTGLRELYLSDNSIRQLPKNLCGRLSGLFELRLHNNKLTKLPELDGLESIQFLSAHNNTIRELPRFVPPEMTHLYLTGNPLESTATELSKFLELTAKHVEWFDLSVSPSDKIYFARPDVCSQKYVDQPIQNLDKCVVKIDLDSGSPSIKRKRVTVGSSKQLGLVCRIAEPCAFTLQLRDAGAYDVRVGGAKLTMKLQGHQEQYSLTDNHDGTYTAVIPPTWLQRVTDKDYNTSAHPQFIELSHQHANRSARVFHAAMTMQNEQLCSTRAHFLTCPLQLHVQPPNCVKMLGVLGMHDPSDNSQCQCSPDSYRVAITNGAVTCKAKCPENQQRDNIGNGDTCVCMKGTYNSTRFPLRMQSVNNTACMFQYQPWTPPVRHLVCKRCPQQCTLCVGSPGAVFDGVPTIKAGWRVVRSEIKSNASAVSGKSIDRCDNIYDGVSKNISIFQCNADGGNQSHPSCPEYRLDQSCPICAYNHSGVLCDSCSNTFAREGLNCRRCDGTVQGLYRQYSGINTYLVRTLSTIWVVYLIALHKRYTKVVCIVVACSALVGCVIVLSLVSLLITLFGWTLPMVAFGMAAFVAIALKRHRDDEGVQSLRCNIRILIGLMQVMSLLYTALDVTFPRPYSKGTQYVGFLSANSEQLLTILELQCIEQIDFYARWTLQVIGLPVCAFVITLLRLGYDREVSQYTAKCGRHCSRVCCPFRSMENMFGNFIEYADVDEIPEVSRASDGSPSATSQAREKDDLCEHLNKLEQRGFPRDKAKGALDCEGSFEKAARYLADSRAASNWKKLTAFWVFILYAPTSATIVKMFQCRSLGDTFAVVEADNQIQCSGTKYDQFWWLAFVLSILIPLGVPVVIIWWMWSNWVKNQHVSLMEEYLATLIQEELALPDVPNTDADIFGILAIDSLAEIERNLVDKIKEKFNITDQGAGNRSESWCTVRFCCSSIDQGALKLDLQQSRTVRKLSLRLLARLTSAQLKQGFDLPENHGSLYRAFSFAMCTRGTSAGQVSSAGRQRPVISVVNEPRGCFGPVDRRPLGSDLGLMEILRDPDNPLNMNHFDFILADYRDGYFWFEPYDLFRKVSLTSLPQFIGRGSASQYLVVCCLSVVCLGLQVHLSPYRRARSNLLKLAAEANIFLLAIVAFWMKSTQDIYFEPESSLWYAGGFWVFTSCVILFCFGDLIWVCCTERQRIKALELTTMSSMSPLNPQFGDIAVANAQMAYGNGHVQVTRDDQNVDRTLGHDQELAPESGGSQGLASKQPTAPLNATRARRGDRLCSPLLDEHSSCVSQA